MKVLIVHAHAEPKSFVSSMKNMCVDILKSKGCEVKVSDLYDMKYYNPLGPEDFIKLQNPSYFKPQAEQDALIKPISNFTARKPRRNMKNSSGQT